MSNVIAGVIRGQYSYLEEHIAQKKAIYERYREGLKGLPVTMNPITNGTEPNYWLSALIIDKDYMCQQVRGDLDVCYRPEKGKTCPMNDYAFEASLHDVDKLILPILEEELPDSQDNRIRFDDLVGRQEKIYTLYKNLYENKVKAAKEQAEFYKTQYNKALDRIKEIEEQASELPHLQL